MLAREFECEISDSFDEEDYLTICLSLEGNRFLESAIANGNQEFNLGSHSEKFTSQSKRAIQLELSQRYLIPIQILKAPLRFLSAAQSCFPSSSIRQFLPFRVDLAFYEIFKECDRACTRVRSRFLYSENFSAERFFPANGFLARPEGLELDAVSKDVPSLGSFSGGFSSTSGYVPGNEA